MNRNTKITQALECYVVSIYKFIWIITIFMGCSNNMSELPKTNTIRIAQQDGLGYLPLQMIREHRLIEKHAAQLGSEMTIEWLSFSGGEAMNDALISHDLDIASGGIAPLIKAWDETIGSHGIKGIACLNEMPNYLNTNRDDIKTLKDFTIDDTIALPSVKISIQARILQMAAEQAGMSFDALDNITISLSHQDGVDALTLDSPKISGHFTSPPFMYQELKNEDPKIHRVISSYEVLGGPSTFNCVWTAAHFREENPVAYRVFLDALTEAIEMINADKDAVVDVYIKQAESSLDPAFVREILNNTEITFKMAPTKSMKYAEFMYKVGAINNKPNNWKDYFFDEIHDLDGS